jgi:hypothetical protein
MERRALSSIAFRCFERSAITLALPVLRGQVEFVT